MFQEVVWFIQGNWDTLGQLVIAVVVVAELAVRLTPTKTDDGAVERVGAIIRKALDLLKVPNRVKDDLK